MLVLETWTADDRIIIKSTVYKKYCLGRVHVHDHPGGGRHHLLLRDQHQAYRPHPCRLQGSRRERRRGREGPGSPIILAVKQGVYRKKPIPSQHYWNDKCCPENGKPIGVSVYIQIS